MDVERTTDIRNLHENTETHATKVQLDIKHDPLGDNHENYIKLHITDGHLSVNLA